MRALVSRVRNLTAALVVMAGLVLGFAAEPASAAPYGGTTISITINITNPAPGTTISITISGAGPGETITITINIGGVATPIGTATADAAGNVTTPATVPATAHGVGTISAVSKTKKATASAPVKVASAGTTSYTSLKSGASTASGIDATSLAATPATDYSALSFAGDNSRTAKDAGFQAGYTDAAVIGVGVAAMVLLLGGSAVFMFERRSSR